MGRTYRLIKDGKFSDEKEFDVNFAGYMYLGLIMHSLGLPVSNSPIPAALHEITGETAEAIRKMIGVLGFKQLVIQAIEKVENRDQYSADTIEEDADWVMEFLNMALNPEGFASDYCDQYENET